MAQTLSLESNILTHKESLRQYLVYIVEWLLYFFVFITVFFVFFPYFPGIEYISLNLQTLLILIYLTLQIVGLEDITLNRDILFIYFCF